MFFRSLFNTRLPIYLLFSSFFFFFNDTATTEIYTLSLHDALPISCCTRTNPMPVSSGKCCSKRSEEHTSELQSRRDLVCRLLLEKKKENVVHHPLGPNNDSNQHKPLSTQYE